jgi:anti-repressor protein
MEMEQKIKIFENGEFGKVRTIIKDGEPWFVGKDVAKILEYRNTKKALSDHVDEEDKYQGDGVTIRDPMGRVQHPTIINESGLYSLILSSKMPRAKEFKHWVTSEILPTIRRTGGYVTNEEMFIENYLPFLDEPYRDLFRLQMTAIEKLNERIRHNQPLVEFANQVTGTNDLIDMNAMAKLARAENIPVGRNKLYSWLKRTGVLMSNNLPYQRYIDRGYFAVKESVFEVNGLKKTYRQTFVTGKGQLFIISLLRKYYGKEILQ